MVAIKPASVPRFLKSPDTGVRAVLVYGPDGGLVSERASAMQRIFEALGDTETVRLDERDLAEGAGRLEIELRTLPMFARNKVVRVGAGSGLDTAGLKALLAEPLEAALIIEAGSLRPDSALRKLFEALPHAAALPCYAEARDLDALIDEELGAAGLAIDRETRAYLTSRLGADQALSRSEVVKLGLYAAGQTRVSPEDVDAVVGDSSELAVEDFAYQVSGEETKAALRQLQRLAAAGTPPQVALAALGRHFLKLYAVAAATADGGSAEAALRRLRPPLHFKRRDMFLAHCRRWGCKRLLAALPRIRHAVTAARRAPELEQAHAERLVLALTRPG